MEKRKLCKDMLVNPLGFGGIPIQRISFKEANNILNLCLDKGINFFDTARGYTDSEEKIGKAISKRKKEFFIATKSTERTKQGMLKDIEISLNNLKVKKIDLYQLHNIKDEEDLKNVMKEEGAYFALKEAKEKGLIGHIGITSHKPEVIEKALKLNKFETIQVPFNIIESQFLKVIEKANKLGVGVIVMKPLAGGAYENAVPALKWALNQDISVIIPGMQSLKEVNENTALAENPVLTKEEEYKLNQEAKNMDKNICRRCEYCTNNCPQGIDIMRVLLFENYYKRYKLQDWAKERYQKTIKIKPDVCIDCGKCEQVCPYGLPIRKMLKQAMEDLG